MDEETFEEYPLCDERGYPILTDENGEPVVDENGDEVIAGYGCMQLWPVDTQKRMVGRT